MTQDQQDEVRVAVPGERRFSRRSFVRKVAVATPAIVGGAALATGLGPQAAAAASTTWNVAGNPGTLTSNYLGTPDNKPLAVRTNNLERLRVTPTGNVGISVTTPIAKLHVRGFSTAAGLFEHTQTTGTVPALQATTASRDVGAAGVIGVVSDPAAGPFSVAVRGEHSGTGADGIGVSGSHAGSGIGVSASSGTGGTAVLATSNNPGGAAVVATNTATGTYQGAGVQGYALSGSDARVHPGGSFWDAGGEFSGLNGVIGAAGPEVADGYGVIGLADNSIGVGVYARGVNGAKALVAAGDADVYGTLTKSGGSFRIDHPLAPATRYLSHSFVESPDMKNVYDGVTSADGAGASTVTLPAWLAALNTDFRYQLTAIGGPAPDLHVSAEFDGTSFAIGGAAPGQKISWQLTGIRQDVWANANRIPDESDKPAADKGRYLHPELFGADPAAEVSSIQVGLQRTSRAQPTPSAG